MLRSGIRWISMNKVLENFAIAVVLGLLTLIALYLVFMFGVIFMRVFGLG